MGEPTRGATYVIRGLGGRPWREWFWLAAPALLLTFWYFDVQFRGDRNTRTLVLGLLLGTWTLVLLARGRIELSHDRIRVLTWGPAMAGSWAPSTESFDVLLREITGVVRDKACIRIAFTEQSVSRERKLALAAPAAEELFDRIAERLAETPEIADRVETPDDRCIEIRPDGSTPG